LMVSRGISHVSAMMEATVSNVEDIALTSWKVTAFAGHAQSRKDARPSPGALPA
jgi:hypothetical protein